MREGAWYESHTKVHMGLSVQGALNNLKGKKKSSFSYADHDNGRPMTYGQLEQHLKKAKFEGKKLLPMGDCDNFDDQTGCKGHGGVVVLYDWKWEEGNG